MNDYAAIVAYGAFALCLFSIAMIWRFSKNALKKRFNLLNYHAKDSDPKTPHAPVA
jgi:hypothetical protein